MNRTKKFIASLYKNEDDDTPVIRSIIKLNKKLSSIVMYMRKHRIPTRNMISIQDIQPELMQQFETDQSNLQLLTNEFTRIQNIPTDPNVDQNKTERLNKIKNAIEICKNRINSFKHPHESQWNNMEIYLAMELLKRNIIFLQSILGISEELNSQYIMYIEKIVGFSMYNIMEYDMKPMTDLRIDIHNHFIDKFEITHNLNCSLKSKHKMICFNMKINDTIVDIIGKTDKLKSKTQFLIKNNSKFLIIVLTENVVQEHTIENIKNILTFTEEQQKEHTIENIKNILTFTEEQQKEHLESPPISDYKSSYSRNIIQMIHLVLMSKTLYHVYNHEGKMIIL